jgi:hypothetical protein
MVADENESVSNTISGGVFFHQVIQGRDITVVLPPQVMPALSGLPAPSTTFTGRDAHVEELLHALSPHEEQHAVPQPPRIAVAGLAGVGKTELVAQVAARALREPDWFPGGVLFVDLLGYDPNRRLSPEQALNGFLRALGIPGEHIPDGLQDLQRLYRSVLAALAHEGRRILVVVDNASGADQVAPLLPSDGMTASSRPTRPSPCCTRPYSRPAASARHASRTPAMQLQRSPICARACPWPCVSPPPC